MIGRLFITSALLLLTAGYLVSANEPEIPPNVTLASVPMTIDTWRGRNDPPFTKEILAVLGADDYIIRTYFAPPQQAVNLYVGFHASQRQSDTIHSPLNCLPGAGWLPVRQDRTTFDVTNAQGVTSPITVNEFVIQKGLDRQLVLYWYQSHGRVVASEYTSKIYLVADSIRLNRTDAALVRVITPMGGDRAGADDGAVQRAREFVQALFPRLSAVLPL